METLKAFGPEIMVFCAVFAVLSLLSFLYTHVKIIRWIVGFMLFRAFIPLIGAAAMYGVFFWKH